LPPTVGSLAVAMALRVKGRASAAAVALATGLGEPDVVRLLDAACTRGTAERPKDGTRYALTPEGRGELERLLESERGARAALEAAYEWFLAVDAALKDRITAWQTERTGLRLAAVHAAGSDARTLVPSLVAVAPRYGRYAHRLDRALTAIARGDERFVAHPAVDSLHQVWFELHEDLLVVLGRPRAS
jgi:hypothetical protein